jgi:hypothetical protein
VDVRDQGGTDTYEKAYSTTFTIAGCTSAGLSANPPSPQKAGTQIVLTGSASCQGTPEYRFWVKAPGGSWQIKQDYSSSATFNWNTIGLGSGMYGLEVDVRNQGSTGVYERVANLTYVLNP